MRTYRAANGEERLWFDDGEIDRIMESELARGGLMPPAGGGPVDLEALVEDHLGASLDQYADLPSAVLGLTEFPAVGQPCVRINQDLTGSAMDSEWCPPGIHGRWRATVAHEAAHIVLHRTLFRIAEGQTALFETPEPVNEDLLRCLKRDVAHTGRTYEWREVQANHGMAAILMPRSIFLEAARAAVQDSTRKGIETATRHLASLFETSREAAAIRLQALGFRVATTGDLLFTDAPGSKN